MTEALAGIAVAEAAPRYSIRAVERTLGILDLLRQRRGSATLREIAAAIGLPKSSAFRYLSTLEQRGYVVRQADEDRFRLGHGRGFMRPGEVARLCSVAAPRMQELCRQFNETINLGTLDHHRIVYLEVIESPRAMRFAAVRGSSDSIHSSALGKAIASTLREDEISGILAAEGMPALTERTITAVETFLREMDLVRARGYAVDDEENEDGGRCVAVALPFDPAAAISLSAPSARFASESLPEVAEALTRAAGNIAQEVRDASR